MNTITIFTIPKAFEGDAAIIQHNAVKSWTLLRPRPEIILFGKESGIGEACKELGLKNIQDIKTGECGVPVLSDAFEKAQKYAQNDTICYINADIILMDDFTDAVNSVSGKMDNFMLVGSRKNLDIKEKMDFSAGWSEKLKRMSAGKKNLNASDLFVFKRGQIKDMPPFLAGRSTHDNWLLYWARKNKISLVDLTPAVTIIHQSHGYFCDNYAKQVDHKTFLKKSRGAEYNQNLAPQALRYNLCFATHILKNKNTIKKAPLFYRLFFEIFNAPMGKIGLFIRRIFLFFQ